MAKASKIETADSISFNEAKSSRKAGFLADLKLLVKGAVLIVNTLPIITSYLIALYVYDVALSSVLPNFMFIVFGGLFVMAGALIFNNWYEVDLDEKMERTQRRPTVTGSLSLKSVLNLAIVFSLLGFILLSFTNAEVMLYAFIGWFTYVVLYTFLTKRKYTINTIIGSLSGAVTPLIGWAAVGEVFHIVPIIMFVVLFLWQIPHTFAIAIRRYDDYKRANVPMLPVAYGFKVTKRQMFVYILCLLPLPLYLISLSTIYVISMMVMNVLWIILALKGFKTENHFKWANQMFKFSLIYINIFFIGMYLTTFI